MADNFAFMVRLTALGITSLQALSDRASEAASQENDAEDIAKVLTAARLMAAPAVVEPGRADLPVRRRYASAAL